MAVTYEDVPADQNVRCREQFFLGVGSDSGECHSVDIADEPNPRRNVPGTAIPGDGRSLDRVRPFRSGPVD